jgi:hypothetical protein
MIMILHVKSISQDQLKRIEELKKQGIYIIVKVV